MEKNLNACPAGKAAPESAPPFGVNRFARLKAEFAKHGHTLHASSAGYLATRWGMARPLPTLDAAEAFLIQVEGGRHDL